MTKIAPNVDTIPLDKWSPETLEKMAARLADIMGPKKLFNFLLRRMVQRR